MIITFQHRYLPRRHIYLIANLDQLWSSIIVVTEGIVRLFEEREFRCEFMKKRFSLSISSFHIVFHSHSYLNAHALWCFVKKIFYSFSPSLSVAFSATKLLSTYFVFENERRIFHHVRIYYSWRSNFVLDSFNLPY